MMHCIQSLAPTELPKYASHLLRLDAHARRLRFGHPASDETVRRHVDTIDLQRDRILVQYDDNRDVIAAAHVARGDDASVEFAFSVDAAWRGRGIGRQLFEQAKAWARNRGFQRAHLFFLAENVSMRRLTQSAGMTIRADAGECEGAMSLPPPTPFSVLREISAERFALYEHGQRRWMPLIAASAA
jgi:GNAT superfamily N-acetyltransferase